MESRLRHLQAEESFYMSLIAKAQTIQEMITIREHLDSIQLEKEKAQGRKNFLDHRSGTPPSPSRWMRPGDENRGRVLGFRRRCL